VSQIHPSVSDERELRRVSTIEVGRTDLLSAAAWQAVGGGGLVITLSGQCDAAVLRMDVASVSELAGCLLQRRFDRRVRHGCPPSQSIELSSVVQYSGGL
jgi:hypothetical protein